MRIRFLLPLLSLALPSAYADMTRYGFSGINYVPSDEKYYGPDITGTYFHAVKNGWDEDVYPGGTCLLFSLKTLPLEIGLSNVYRLSSGGLTEGYSPQYATDYFPVVPSLKYALGETPTAWGQWRLASGFAMPYGVYAVAGFESRFPFFQPYVTAGLSSRFSTLHIFGGTKLYFADAKRHRFPLYFSSDFAFANSLKKFDQVEELFYSAGLRMDAGQHLQLGMVYRVDGNYQRLENHGFLAFSITAFFNPISRRNPQ